VSRSNVYTVVMKTTAMCIFAIPYEITAEMIFLF